MSPNKTYQAILCIFIGSLGTLTGLAELFDPPHRSIPRVLLYLTVGPAAILLGRWLWKSRSTTNRR